MKAKPAHLILAALALACAAGTCAAGIDAGDQAAYDAYLRTTLKQVEVPAEPDASLRHTRPEEVKPKSTIRAVLLSALVPGLGEIYVGGRRGYVTGGVLVGIDVVSIYKYFDLNSQGDDLRDDYRKYADTHYSRDRFDDYVHKTIAQANSEFIYCQLGPEFDEDGCDSVTYYYFPLSGDDDFYEQIDTVDRFAFGWADFMHQDIYDNAWNSWDPDMPVPGVVETETARRLTYRGMREDANDAYSSADKYAWFMIITRVVSVVDTLILTRLHNSRIASLGSKMNLSLQVKSITDPAFRVGVKMRF